jgi:predicted DNA binding CopG/RHH family protein
MSELGINISKNSGNLIEDQKVLNDSLTDIEKVQSFQKKAMNFFKVDVSVLEKQK